MLPSRLNFLLMSVLLAACAGPDDASSPSTMPTAPRSEPLPSTSQPLDSPSASAPGSVPAGPSNTPEPTIAADPPPLALECIAGGFAEPIGIEPLPDGSLLVQERAGRLIGLDPRDGSTWVVVDLRDRITGGGERGLLGVALHPGWPDAARAFVHYSDRDGNTVLAELRSPDASAERPTLDAGSERILLTAEQPFSNHNGGQLAFGPDGYLWLGLGDGGSGGDPRGNGQDPGTLLGAILRLDVDSEDGYAIPPDNPFADGGGAPEVYHYGLRNPWRFSFDAAGGELFVADVGQNAYEEVNRVGAGEGGLNFGWNVMEASHCYGDAGCTPVGVEPWAEYGHDRGCSVTGGYVYRGSRVGGLWGWYVFSDFCAGAIFGISLAEPVGDGPLSPRALLETDARISSFGQGADGELYVADLASGTVYRIVGG